MKRLVMAALAIAACAFASTAQTSEPQVNRDPEKARLVTSDIDNFWRAFDLASKETDRQKRIAVFQTEYLDKGSTGLKDFVQLRIRSAKVLVETIDRLPKYYASIRPSTLRVREMEKQMRKSFRSLKKLYPGARFPDVYFVIGISNTGGTASRNGLLIGTEMYGLTPETPREELPDWMKSVLKPIEKLPPIVAHELVHFTQVYPEPKTVLGKSIQEGSADFISELIAGETINPVQKAYGDKNEAVLWREFQADMETTNIRNWMYNGATVKDRPGDLGYYVGYKICRSYYENAKDKRQAIRDILEIKDFKAFLERSRYPEKFAK